MDASLISAARSGGDNSHACALCGAEHSCLPVLFQGVAANAFDQMITGKRRVERHGSLFRANDKFDTLYVVRFGQFKEFICDPARVQRVVRFYLPGEIMGFDGVATGLHRSRVMALENSEVCELPYVHVTKALREQAQFLERFLATMSATLLDQHRHSALLTLSSLDARFACFLLHLSDSYARLGYSGGTFRLAMSRSDIGSYLGTTVETVSRLIARFNVQRSVRIERRLVQILDRARLLTMIDPRGGMQPTVPTSTEILQLQTSVH